jgi:hypothetical protein
MLNTSAFIYKMLCGGWKDEIGFLLKARSADFDE